MAFIREWRFLHASLELVTIEAVQYSCTHGGDLLRIWSGVARVFTFLLLILWGIVIYFTVAMSYKVFKYYVSN